MTLLDKYVDMLMFSLVCICVMWYDLTFCRMSYQQALQMFLEIIILQIIFKNIFIECLLFDSCTVSKVEVRNFIFSFSCPS